MDDHAARLLALVARPDYKPRTSKALAHKLEVASADYPAFRDAIKQLVKEGKLTKAKDRTIGPSLAIGGKDREKGLILGTFKRNPKGFGFVRPKQATGRHADIYIAPDDSLDASSGDEVAVRVTKKSFQPGKGPSGKITKVVVRASAQFVGTYYEESGAGFVRIDGTTFSAPLYVGDPGAKGAQPGDKVALEIVRYPAPGLEGEGVITEVLGPRGQPGVDTLSIIRAYNLPDEFDPDVLEDAREQAHHFHEDQIADRLDLRDVLTVTIDPATARDFDDAITLSRDEKGYWQLGVHIADVGHFVKPGSPLDRSARKRGNSVYLPDRVLPMLPEVLSNSLASLQQDRTRYTVSALLEFNADGVLTDHRFARSAIRVDRRFTYEQALEVMRGPAADHEGVTPEIRDLVARMLELAMILRKRRFARGALELVMPEVEVDLDPKSGQVAGAHLAPDDESHEVIEEFMLAANEAVSSFLTEHKAGFLRRVHADPDPRKLAQFAEFADSLGYKIEDPQSRFELQRVLRESDGEPERHAIHFGLLRSLKQAVYTPEHEGHYALASQDYCHFTSPIRRYPDLQVHRTLTAIIAGKKPKFDAEELVVLGESCTRTERRAEAAERELIKLKLLTHLETRLGETFHAVITGVEDFGFFVQLAELPVEGLIHVTALSDDYYYLESETHTLIGRRSGHRYRLGDRLEVRVSRVDVDRRELDLVLGGETARAAGIDEAEEHLPVSRTGTRGRSGQSAVSPPAARKGADGPRSRPGSSAARKPSASPKRAPKLKRKKKGRRK